MAKMKLKVYLVEMNDKAKTKRLIAATNPAAARIYACKQVTATLASALDMYKSGLTLENAPEEEEPVQSVIPMTAAGRPVTHDDDIRYASQA
jgi:hypothetical protein